MKISFNTIANFRISHVYDGSKLIIKILKNRQIHLHFFVYLITYLVLNNPFFHSEICYIMLRQQNQLRRKIVCVQFEMMWVKLMIAQSVVLGVGNRQKGTFILGFIAATPPPPDYQLLLYAFSVGNGHARIHSAGPKI